MSIPLLVDFSSLSTFLKDEIHIGQRLVKGTWQRKRKQKRGTKENKYSEYPQTGKVYDFICKNCRVTSIAVLRERSPAFLCYEEMPRGTETRRCVVELKGEKEARRERRDTVSIAQLFGSKDMKNGPCSTTFIVINVFYYSPLGAIISSHPPTPPLLSLPRLPFEDG